MEGDSTRLSQIRFNNVNLNSLQVLAKKGLLEGVLTCNLKFGEHYVLNKKTQVKFGTIINRSADLLDCIHVDV